MRFAGFEMKILTAWAGAGPACAANEATGLHERLAPEQEPPLEPTTSCIRGGSIVSVATYTRDPKS